MARRMTREVWYLAYILSIFAGALFFDGCRIRGGICLGVSVLIVIVCDGFGVQL